MIKYKLKMSQEFRLQGRPIEEAFVFLQVQDPTVDSEILYQGPELLLKEIKMNLIGSYGERGRVIEGVTSGYDLNNAMNSWLMRPFEPELVEGRALLEKSGAG